MMSVLLAAARAAVALALLSLLASVLLSLVAFVLVPGLTIQRAWLGSIRRISWNSPARNGDAAARIQLDLRLLGWTVLWRTSDRERRTPSLVIRAHGVQLRVPRAWLVAPRPTPPPPSPSPSASATPRAEGSTKDNEDGRTLKRAQPGAISLPRVVARLLPFVRWISLEVDALVVVEDVLTLSTTLRAGVHSLPTSTDSSNPKAAAWLSLSTLLVHELARTTPSDAPPKPSLPTPSGTPAPPPPTSTWPAVSILEPVVIRAEAPLAFLPGVGGAGLKIAFGRGAEGVHVRVHELKRILRALEDIEHERKANTPTSDASELSSEEVVASAAEKGENKTGPGPLSPIAAALLASLSLELSLPLFVVSAHYTTPLHILAISPNRPLPKSVAFALTVKDVAFKLNLGGTTDQLDAKEQEHRPWFGKGQDLAARVAIGWEEIAGRIRVDGSEEDILPDSAKAFTIGPSSLHVSTTWLPPALAALRPITLALWGPQPLNDSTIVITASIGTVRGHLTFETYDSALRIFKARPRPRPKTQPSFASLPSAPPKFIRELPRAIGSLRLEGIEVRIQAPAAPEAKKREGVAYSEDQFYREWMSPDVFCVTLPGVDVAFGGEYLEKSLKRTDQDRRRIKRLSRRPDDEADPQSDEENEVEGVQDLVQELGVPPPPPIHNRRSHGDDFRLAGTAEVERRPLEYRARFNANVEILNVFILATNDGTADPADATSWLDDKLQKLPSDPIQFDILAIGPLEVVASSRLLGVDGGALDLRSRTGEVAGLIETIGIDLWRPPVMSALRDFLESSASASATSTLRAPLSSPLPPPAPKPLVDTLPAEIAVYIAIASLDLRIAGSDPKNNDVLACRGIAAHSDSIVVEYLLQHALHKEGINFPARASLSLREDIRVEANAHVEEGDARCAALVKFAVKGLHIDPVVDARSSKGHTRHSSAKGRSEEEGADWELKNRAEIVSESKQRRKHSVSIVPVRKKEAAVGLVTIPEIDVRVTVVRAPWRDEVDAPLDSVTVAVEADTLSFKLELFSIYLFLVAIATVKSLRPASRPSSVPTSPNVDATPPRPPAAKRPPPAVSVRADVADLHVFLTLPHDVPLYIHTRRLRAQVSPAIGTIAEADMLLLAGMSPTARGQWEDIFRLRIMAITIKPDPDRGHPFIVALVADSARLRIPFRYVFAQIIDNAVNLVKALKQLIHQHIKGGLDWILEPEVEQAKRLPKIDLNVKMFAVEIQDDPFETRLNIIWRAGYEEQLARLERAAAFELKVDAIHKLDAHGGDESSEDDPDITTGRHNPKVNGKHTISIAEARQDLKAFDSSHWVKRMRNAVAEQGRREEANTRRLYGVRRLGDSKLPIDLLPTSRSAPLARIMLWDLRFVVTKPMFPVSDFLFDVGKGLPRETQFTLLVPLHFSWKMDQARVQLRDYPLPLLHVPPMPYGDGDDRASWECEANLVIAEELGGLDAIRRVPCVVVPARHTTQGAALYSIVVPRSAMTVKTYATPTIKVRSPLGTRIGWGNSIQPAIQDVTKVLDTLSKASPDPSERIGFWDKLRLQFHWRVKVLFEGEGPVHFHIKGTRDPYSVTGFGAGFVKTWSGNVKFLIGFPNPDREFVQIESERYVLGIPNLRSYVDAAASGLARDPTEKDDRATQHSGATGGESGGRTFGPGEGDGEYVKICAKFINGVRWGMGAVLERACTIDCHKASCAGKSPFHRQCRFFDFIPHWEVHTKTATAVKPDGKVDDSFAGFRSDFIHFSISLTSPLTLPLPSNAGKVEEESLDGTEGYNSLHFSPQAATHFWAWWRLFDGSMSLPIRQGKLFPSAPPPSKKFGKHCATIKYRFSLAPLFMAHTYRQEAMADWVSGETTMVGLKGKIGRFNVDLHQRAQEQVVRKPNSTETKTILRKAFYQAEVDLDGVDLRVLSAVFKEPEKEYFAPEDADEDEDAMPPSNEEYSVADEDLEWIDLDDFVDAAYTIPDRNPRLRVIPFTVCPRFNYYRQTDAAPKADAQEPAGADEPATLEHSQSKFGGEPSHTCLMGCSTDPVAVQLESAKARLAELEAEAERIERSPSEGPDTQFSHPRLRIIAIQKIIDRLVAVGEGRHNPLDADQAGMDDPFDSRAPRDEAGVPNATSALYQAWGDWTNRYMVHNPTIQLSNTSRDVLLKYYYSQRERRGFMYHLSAKAIKFIRDLSKEHAARKRKERDQPHRGQSKGRGSQHTATTQRTAEDAQKTERLLDGVSGGLFFAPNESEQSQRHAFGDALDVDPDSAADSLPDSFDLLSGHLCIFIKPQISLKSDIDDKSSITLTAFRAQLKSFEVVDTRNLDDPVNSQVLHQTYAALDGLQAFYPQEKTDRRAGAAFVPLETLVDLSVEPWGFDRVVPRTSAALRWDKFNQLRMSSKNGTSGSLSGAGPQDSHFSTGTDRVSVECDKFSVSADPDHFAAIYNVVTDLLLYSDPLQKSRNKKLEEVVFTQDFTNLSGISNKVAELQQRIRELVDLGQQYQVHLDELDEEGRLDLFATRMEFAKLSAELNIYVQAIARAQNSNGVSSSAAGKTAGVQFEARASELVWHMLDASGTPFAKFSVRGVEFSWISKQDSSVSNRLVIRDLKALNSSPEQVYAEIIAKHDQGEEHELAKVDVFAAILWNSLAPVGGISIVEQFELHLHPIRLQLEHQVGRNILNYVFSQRKGADEEPPTSDTPPRGAPRSTLSPLGSSAMGKSSESLALSTRGGQNGSAPSSRPRSFLESSSSAPNRSVVGLAPSEPSTRLRKVASADVLRPQIFEEGLDADEMRRRASINRTFILVDFSPTVLYLTYRSEKEDHSHLPNIYNLTYRTPSIQYRSKTWSFLDLLDQLKKDTIKSIWSQKGALVGQLLSTAHRRLPLQDARTAAKTARKSLKSRLLGTSLRAPSPSIASNDGSTLRPTDGPSSRPGSSTGLVRTRSAGSESSSDSEPLPVSPHILDEPGAFSNEPDEMSLFSNSQSSTSAHATSRNGREERLSDELLVGAPTDPPASPIRHSTHDRHAASLPALNSTPPAEEVSFPIHRPLPHRTLDDKEKARLLGIL